MSILRAEELKKITKESEIDCVSEFWEWFSQILNNYLVDVAKGRQDRVCIGYHDEIAKTKQGSVWIAYKPLREKVEQELKLLGYKFIYDSGGARVVIEW